MALSISSKLGHGLAKVLRIEHPPASLKGANVPPLDAIIDGTYIEEDPTVAEWLLARKPTLEGAWKFFLSLFPFLSWMGKYNMQWFLGDLIAGVTVGTVVVPQGMAYAGLALLPPEYGLYSSFVGVLLYWFFATSKDITIGPVAVMSTLVGNIVTKAQATNPDLSAAEIGSALAVISGCIVFAIGLLRLGFIVDYIPLPAIAAFMTGSALNIAVGQVPGMLGIKGFSNRESTYKVLINTLKHLDRVQLDAAMGLTGLFLLYVVRWVFTSWAPRRYPKWSKTFFFISTLRTAFTMLFYTMISWLANMNRRDDPAFRILGKVPRGFQHLGIPRMNGEIISTFVAELPATVIVLLIEHIAISKSFGRLNNYTINPSQELIAIGFTNIFGPFFGAYPATGSFSRTAIKSKAGVRTPFAGVITAGIVLLAIYALTAVFFYIPQATLSAVIIHAVGDLITPLIHPIEVVIFFAGVIVTVFMNIETGIYVTVAASGAVLLFRIAKARGQFLGAVKVHSIVADQTPQSAPSSSSTKSITDYSQSPLSPQPQPPYTPSLSGKTEILPPGTATPVLSPKVGLVTLETVVSGSFCDATTDNYPRNVFLPIDRRDGTNPNISIVSPYPGIFIYRFSEGLVYSNAGHYTDHLVSKLFKWTKPGPILQQLNESKSMGDRSWNDPGPRKNERPASEGGQAEVDGRPTLKAIILDFSSVNNVDITSVQNLIDVRNQLDRYAAPDKVDWHFAAIRNRWTKRALASAGFGVANEDWMVSGDASGGQRISKVRPVFSVAEIGCGYENRSTRRGRMEQDLEAREGGSLDGCEAEMEEERLVKRRRKVALVSCVARPFFHPDVEGALRSAIHNVEHR
ncbi:putative sulfate permease 2 [Kalaharituber pfeilii]|nr:putative sulfate permease 2 [Kalaharituber pfeilii]